MFGCPSRYASGMDADRAAALRHLRWAVAELPLAADQWWQSAAQEAFRAQLNRLRLGLNAIENRLGDGPMSEVVVSHGTYVAPRSAVGGGCGTGPQRT